MRAFQHYTTTHADLAAISMESAANAPGILLVQSTLDADGGTGDYCGPGWLDINYALMEAQARDIEASRGSSIILMGADVVFLRDPCDELNGLLATHDILFQCESESIRKPNPDLMAVRCSDSTAAFMARLPMALKAEGWRGEFTPQANVIQALATQLTLTIGLLPMSYANRVNGGWGKEMVMFHANNTPPPGCVRQKVGLMRKAMEEARG